MAVKNLMLDDLRKELRKDMHLCINNATLPLYAEIQQLKQEYHILCLQYSRQLILGHH
jgi:hypothetical protein